MSLLANAAMKIGSSLFSTMKFAKNNTEENRFSNKQAYVNFSKLMQ